MRAFYWGALMGFAAVCLMTAVKADDKKDLREFQKQILYLQYTEICSTPLPRGGALTEALNKAMEQDPKTWLPWVLWWNELRDKYMVGQCGDT